MINPRSLNTNRYFCCTSYLYLFVLIITINNIEGFPYSNINFHNKTASNNSELYLKELNQQNSQDSLFQSNEKTIRNPYLAVGLSILLPSAGHAYIGEWKKSWKFLALETGALVLMLSAIKDKEYDRQYQRNFGDYQTRHYGYSQSNKNRFVGGFLLYYGFRFWEYYNVYSLTKNKYKKNNELLLKTKITLDWGLSFHSSENDFDYEIFTSLVNIFNVNYLTIKLTDKSNLLLDFGNKSYSLSYQKYWFGWKRNTVFYNIGYRKKYVKNYGDNEYRPFHMFQLGYSFEKKFHKRMFWFFHRDIGFYFRYNEINSPLTGKQINRDLYFYCPGYSGIGISFNKVSVYLGLRTTIIGRMVFQDQELIRSSLYEAQNTHLEFDQVQQIGIGFKFTF